MHCVNRKFWDFVNQYDHDEMNDDEMEHVECMVWNRNAHKLLEGKFKKKETAWKTQA